MKQYRYKKLFRSHINFIINSCELFDKGVHDEAIRIALSFRVIFYDSGNMISLLKSMGVNKLKLKFISEMRGLGYNKSEQEHTKVFFNPSAIAMRRLEDMQPYSANDILLKWNDWWHEMIFATNDGIITRSIILSNLVNKDGGAHVDEYERLSQSYRGFSEGNWMHIQYPGEEKKPFRKFSNLIVMRNMAQEILRSPDIYDLYNRP